MYIVVIVSTMIVVTIIIITIPIVIIVTIIDSSRFITQVLIFREVTDTLSG